MKPSGQAKKSKSSNVTTAPLRTDLRELLSVLYLDNTLDIYLQVGAFADEEGAFD